MSKLCLTYITFSLRFGTIGSLISSKNASAVVIVFGSKSLETIIVAGRKL